jgi:hypothetical protein
MNGQEPDGLRDRYFRERRLLLGISVILLARQFLGVEVGRSADTLGLHFEIQDPERLWWAVWALWFWSFVCCIQQLNSLRPYIHFPIDRRTRTYNALRRRWARIRILWAVRASFHRQVQRENRVRYSVSMPGMEMHPRAKATPAEQIEYAEAQVEVRWLSIPERPRDVALVDDTAVGDDDWIVRSSGDGLSNATPGGQHGPAEERYHRGTAAIPQPRRSHWSWAAAQVWTWATTSFLTDYVAPALIGLAPLVTAGIQFWRGAPRAPIWV